MCARFLVLFALLAALAAAPAHARTVFRCERDGSVSLATGREPGAKCEAYVLDDFSAALPSFWRAPAPGAALFAVRNADGETVFTTRAIAGARRIGAGWRNAPSTPSMPAYRARPRPEVHDTLFEAAARENAIDDAWLRAIAQVESDFQARARSPKGAKGIMQLMPSTASRFRVRNPYSPEQSIAGGARFLGVLLRRCDGNRRRASAAYNAGARNVDRYGGVPPFAETQAYVGKVEALYQLYQTALASNDAGVVMLPAVRALR
jgi:soluble lytic murein transglycosylase-like protein